jgi:hypothetical protein
MLKASSIMGLWILGRVWFIGKVSSSDNFSSLPNSYVNLVVWFAIRELVMDSIKDA